MAKGDQQVTLIVVVVAVVVIWWLWYRRQREKKDKEARHILREIEEERRKAADLAVNQGMVNYDQMYGDIEGFNHLQTNYNTQSYDFVPPGSPQSNVKYVNYEDVAFGNGGGGNMSAASCPNALKGMSQEEINNKMNEMDQKMQMRDPTSSLPSSNLLDAKYNGKDLTDIELYKAGRSIPTFGLNYRPKGRNFELNVRGNIVPGDFWDGWFQSRFSRSQYVHSGGVLESPTNTQRVRDFEARRQRRVVRSGKDIIVT